MLKIKANVLRDFLVKTTSDGLINDSKLVFDSVGLKMCHKDEPGVILIAGVLDKSNFSEYEEMTLEIKNNKVLLQALKTFKDNLINIVKADNMAKILDENGSIDLALAEKIICYKENVPALEYDNKILVKKSMIDTIIERSSIVESDEVFVSNKAKELMLSIGKESDKANSKAMSNLDKEINTSFDLAYFKAITSKLDPIFDFSIRDDNLPSVFSEKTDKYSIMYYITPVTDEQKKETVKAEKKEETEAVKTA